MNTQNNTAEAAVSPSIDSLPTATTPARPYRSSLASRRLNPSQVVLTEGQAAAIPPVYTQDGQGFFATVYAKFFAGGLTWLATEYDADAGLFFGYVLNHSEPECSELGYFSVRPTSRKQPHVSGTRDSSGKSGIPHDAVHRARRTLRTLRIFTTNRRKWWSSSNLCY